MTDEQPKIFVLDTSVVLYDYMALSNFEEHDVAVPLTVLEELDQFKKGNNVINLHAREFMRQLDTLSEESDLRDWIPINGPGKGRFRVIPEERTDVDTSVLFGSQKNDHRILNSALALAKRESPRKVAIHCFVRLEPSYC